MRVVVQHFFGRFPRQLQYLSVTCQIGQPQRKRNPALLRTFQIARTAQLQIRFGYFKPVVRLRHDLNTLAGISRKLIFGDQNAIGLVGSTPHPST